MIINRWLTAIPVVLAVLTATAQGKAATIRDRAGLFNPDVVRKAEAKLNRLERATHIPVVIETIDAIPGLSKKSSRAEREEAVNALALKRDQQLHDEGLYILISKREHLISNLLVRERYATRLPLEKRDAIRKAFISEFSNQQNYDGGLEKAVDTIERFLLKAEADVPAPLVRHHVGGRNAGGGRSTMGTFLLILVGIFGVLLVLRLVGGLFGRQGAGYPGQMGGMGMNRPGMGPPGPGYYGGQGYGGRGGGFFSGLLGGLGGAFAGNWLYDQMSGRHGHSTSADAYSSESPLPGPGDQGGDAIIGADDHGGRGESWDDGGNGGGDWGGGDGGADWGGGGGDWGGGDGGGDWGGGGGDW
jgi:uncharacterized protein